MKSASTNHFADALTGLLLAISLFAVTPTQAGETGGLDQTRLNVLGDAISRNQDLVSASELARWIMEDRRDFVLLDVRHEQAFQAGHIPGARHLPLRELYDIDQVSALSGHLIVLVYDDTGLRAAQAAAMLRLAGIDAYSLEGGFDHWALHILNPEATPADARQAERREAARRDAIARALKGCETPAPLPDPDPASPVGYTPALAPAEPPPEPADSKPGILLKFGC
jgi:rhodanese-related sulfurtransferase